MKIALLTLALVFSAVAATVLVAAWIFGSQMLEARNADADPSDFPVADAFVETRDGIRLAVNFRPGARPDAPGVLLLHGLGADRGQTAANAEWLAGLGYAVMNIDFRGHGLSTVAPTSLGWDEAIDAHAAFDRLKHEVKDAPVAVVGISLGGAAALIGEDGPVPAEALVLVGVYPDIRRAIGSRIGFIVPDVPVSLLEPLLSWQTLLRRGVLPSQMSPVAALAERDRPTLVVGGERDVFTPPAEIEEEARAAGGPVETWIAPGVDHNGVSDLATPAYRAKLADFLARTIGRP